VGGGEAGGHAGAAATAAAAPAPDASAAVVRARGHKGTRTVSTTPHSFFPTFFFFCVCEKWLFFLLPLINILKMISHTLCFVFLSRFYSSQ
jgi:hypothetical protein